VHRPAHEKGDDELNVPYVGRDTGRPEVEDLLRGRWRYLADIRPPGCLDVAFVRSAVAHAKLQAVDVGLAVSAAGVVYAAAAADLPGLPAVPRAPRSKQPAAMRRPALATDRVRFAGEPVAVVVAENRRAAADAAELVKVDLEALTPVLDPAVAARDDAPRLFDGCGNVSSVRESGAPVDDVLTEAPLVVETSLASQRVAPMSIEPRGILVQAGVDDAYRVWCSHQAPHRLRAALASAFGLDPSKVRVTVPRVGGAFGGKSQTHPEYLIVFALARRLGRPVRWIEDRTEALTAATHGRDQTGRIRLAADTDGRILALDAQIDANVGAYPDFGDFISELTTWVMSGQYAIPRLHVRTRSIVTNKAPVASYRGAGRPEAAYFLERTVDVLAERIGVDPVEVRRRNFIGENAFPYTSPTGAVYDSGRYASALDLAVGLADYDRWRSEQRERRAAARRSKDVPLLGIGVASWIERSGGERGSEEYAAIEVTPDGAVLARVGTASAGQGHEMTFARIAADAIGVDHSTVQVILADTALVRRGGGAYGSRSVQIGGSALFRAGRAALAEATARATANLGGDVGYAGGVFSTAGGRSITLGELVSTTGPLVAEDTFAPPQAFPFGSYVVVVEIDQRTGGIRFRRFVAVDDCGVVVNPGVVTGQVIGSIAQGLGQALYEHVVYDDEGQPITASLLDYHVPTATEMPEVVVGEHVTPNPNVPLGAKGAGESGCIGAPPAIVNAISDALADYDRSALQMPITAARVWQCLQRPRWE
jgi:carbon-monoxide dehydrogenase large subunit